MGARIEVWPSDDGQAFYEVKSANNATLVTSETYKGRTPVEAVRKAEHNARALVRAMRAIDADRAGPAIDVYLPD